jgi:peptidyl-prolyl cis-trans isomerase D
MTPPKATSNKKHAARLKVVQDQMRLIRYIAIGIVVVVVALVGFALINTSPLLRQFQNVASVNGENVSVSEFQMRVKVARGNILNNYYQYVQYYQFFQSDPNLAQSIVSQLQTFESQLDPQNAAILGAQVLDQIITERIIEQEARARGITVSEEEIETEVRAAFGYFPDGTPTAAPVIETDSGVQAYPTLSAAQLALVTATPVQETTATPEPEPVTPEPTPIATAIPEATATPYTLQGYETAVAETIQQFGEQTGMTVAQYRNFIRYNLISKRLFEIITAEVSAETVEEVWARHILVNTEEEAQAVFARLADGEDFAALAAEISIDTGSGISGGDLGWFGRGMMVAPFEEAAFALEKVGDISPAVQSQFGYHIIQLIGKTTRPANATELEQAKQNVFDLWLEGVRAEANISINDTLLRETVPSEPTLQQ